MAHDTLLAGFLFAETPLVEVTYTYRSVPHPDALVMVLREFSTVTQGVELGTLAALVVLGLAEVVLTRPLPRRIRD